MDLVPCARGLVIRWDKLAKHSVVKSEQTSVQRQPLALPMARHIIQKWYEFTIGYRENDRYGRDCRLVIKYDDRHGWDYQLVIENEDRCGRKTDWILRTRSLWSKKRLVERKDDWKDRKYRVSIGDWKCRPLGMKIWIGNWELERTGNKRGPGGG